MDSLAPTIVLELGKIGYQTDLRRQVRGLTHYERADNILYEVDGQVRKFGGATKLNATPLSGKITGMFDFWSGGGSLAFTQRFIATTSDSQVWSENSLGVFTNITGLATITADAIPVFSAAYNKLIIAFSTRNVILKWDIAVSGVVQPLLNAPLGKGFLFHSNRGWIWDGSLLYYSAYGDIENWTTGDSGNFVIDSNDGDEIIGCASHTRSNLIVFKGPNKGSLHVISGTAPTGDDPFIKDVLCRGIPLQTNNSIIALADGDLLFHSPRGIHALSAVQKYGNFAPSDITRYLKKHFREYLNRTNAPAICGVNYAEKNCLLWATTQAGGAENNQMFGLSYARLAEDGWKPFTVTRNCYSLALRKNPLTKIDEVVTGGADGYCRIQDTPARNNDGSPYSFNLTSPRLLIGTADETGKARGDQPVTLERCFLRSESVGTYTATGSITRDNLPPESYRFTLGRDGGFMLGTSILDMDMLGADDAMEIAYADEAIKGECRSFKFSITQGGLNQDANLTELGIEYTPAAQTNISPIEQV